MEVHRRTCTDIDGAAEHAIEDYWTEDGDKELSGPWLGKIVFYILSPPPPPPPPPGYEWVEGRY